MNTNKKQTTCAYCGTKTDEQYCAECTVLFDMVKVYRASTMWWPSDELRAAVLSLRDRRKLSYMYNMFVYSEKCTRCSSVHREHGGIVPAIPHKDGLCPDCACVLS